MDSNIDVNKALYLGLEVTSEIETIHQLVTKTLTKIINTYPKIKDADKILAAIEKGEEPEGWRYPKAHKKWHITTLFKKGKTFNKAHPAFTSFESGKSLSVDVKGVVYVPGKIMFSIVFPDTHVENEFPHMTTLVGEYAPKHSNDVMKALFGKEGILRKEYNSVFKDELHEEEYFECVEVEILGKTEDCYVLKFVEPLVLETEMKAFFK
jgi:hypothetical protein